MTALDTNVLIDVLGAGGGDAEASIAAIARRAARGPLVAAPVVYAELRAHPRGSHDEVNEFLNALRIRVDWALDRSVWDEAGDAFAAYAGRRRSSRGGEPRRLMADFVIGSHAMRAGTLVTRDAGFFRRAFPALRVIDPAG